MPADFYHANGTPRRAADRLTRWLALRLAATVLVCLGAITPPPARGADEPASLSASASTDNRPVSMVLHARTDGRTNEILMLRGADARQQLLASATFANGDLRDVTRDVTLTATPAGVVTISKTGLITPHADG